jgi:hypothetical protein
MIYTNIHNFRLPEAVSVALSNMSNAHSSDLLKNGVFWDVTPCGSCKN